MRSFSKFVERFMNNNADFSKLPDLVQDMVRNGASCMRNYVGVDLPNPIIANDYACVISPESLYYALTFLWAEEFHSIEVYDQSTALMHLLYLCLSMDDVYGHQLPFTCSVSTYVNRNFRDYFGTEHPMQGIVLKLNARKNSRTLRGDLIY